MSYNLFTRSRELFAQLCQIPRPSKQEAAVAEWLVTWAADRGFVSHVDTLWNVMIRTSSLPDPLVLQAHMDMVTLAAPDVCHNFATDPIQTQETDGFLHAMGTTLGADNGVGLCLALAAAEYPDAQPLELLFTVDEERGMSWALEGDFSFLTGKRLLNLDSEEENCLVLASAGGVRHELFVDASVPFDPRWSAYELCLRGGRGGHSGLDIDKNRLNTNYGWCQMVLSLPQTVGVVSVHGGTADNALAAECSGIFVTQNPCDVSALRADWTQRLQQYTDDGWLSLDIVPVSVSAGQPVVPRSVFQTLIETVPQGVVSWSTLIPGLVQTSNNYGIMKCVDGHFSLTLLTRSSVESQREMVSRQITDYAAACGARVVRGSAYPWWEASLSDPWVQTALTALEQVFGTPPAIRAYHAWLECGALVDALWTGASAVSLGPDITGAHTPQEQVDLASWERVARVVQRLVQKAESASTSVC